MRSPAASSRTSVFFQALPLVIGVALLVGLLVGGFYWVTTLSSSPAVAVVAAGSPKTATEIAREADAKADAAAKERQWQKVLAAGAAIRQTMRNPDSIVYEDVRANQDASVMCFQYRAQNGFGGMNREIMAFVNGNPSQNRAVWNKNCTKPMQSLDLALWQLNRH
jgi:hypothetical protein